ncbi:hypothetical protein UVI_02031380 [Ustilaginoidea virens]|uniref:Uncharacterized protein n=1 Tax=Ustilaginoidea virens TaxID=1159556 RepID=A0A1B5KU46_USTVR|nr:hypothetical protein UVI_02031380 [Ustilaginoidea virens]
MDEDEDEDADADADADADDDAAAWPGVEGCAAMIVPVLVPLRHASALKSFQLAADTIEAPQSFAVGSLSTKGTE